MGSHTVIASVRVKGRGGGGEEERGEERKRLRKTPAYSAALTIRDGPAVGRRPRCHPEPLSSCCKPGLIMLRGQGQALTHDMFVTMSRGGKAGRGRAHSRPCLSADVSRAVAFKISTRTL